MTRPGKKHAESEAVVPDPPAQVFARLDDQRLWSARRTKASWLTFVEKFSFKFARLRANASIDFSIGSG